MGYPYHELSRLRATDLPLVPKIRKRKLGAKPFFRSLFTIDNFAESTYGVIGKDPADCFAIGKLNSNDTFGLLFRQRPVLYIFPPFE